ncbi:MAG: type II secretion system protein [Deltaproteobacteria bacterium]|nr:type II secretion system protein [Deltaproteobacteria bacterium]
MGKEPLKKAFSWSSGFTLIEILMSIVVLGIISAGVTIFLFQGVKSLEKLDTTKDQTEEAALAFERFAKESRLVRCAVAGGRCTPSSADILTMTSSEVRFVNINGEAKRFRVSGGAFLFTDGSNPEVTLSGNVSNIAPFEYLKQDSTVAALPADVWRIDISLTLTRGSDSADFKAGVHPRSFR